MAVTLARAVTLRSGVTAEDCVCGCGRRITVRPATLLHLAANGWSGGSLGSSGRSRLFGVRSSSHGFEVSELRVKRGGRLRACH